MLPLIRLTILVLCTTPRIYRTAETDESERQLGNLGENQVYDILRPSGFDAGNGQADQRNAAEMDTEKYALDTLGNMQLRGYKRSFDTLGNMQLHVNKRGLDTLGETQIHEYKKALDSLGGANLHHGYKRFISSLGGAEVHGYKRGFDSLGGAGLHGYKRYISTLGGNMLHAEFKRDMKRYLSSLGGSELHGYKRGFDSLGGANLHHGNKRYIDVTNDGNYKEKLPQQADSNVHGAEHEVDNGKKRELDSLGGFGVHRSKRSDERETQSRIESNYNSGQ